MLNRFLFPRPQPQGLDLKPEKLRADLGPTPVFHIDCGSDTSLIYLHGNGTSIGTAFDCYIPAINWQGSNLYVVEYFGYGAAHQMGQPTEAQTKANMLQSIQAIRAQTQGQRLIIWGHSMGGHLALSLPQSLYDGLILSGTFVTLDGMGPLGIAGRLTAGFNERANLAQLTKPLVSAHAPNDKTVPVSKQRQILQTIPADTPWHTIDLGDQGHQLTAKMGNQILSEAMGWLDAA